MYVRYLFPVLFTTNAAFADGCPVAPDHAAALDELYAQVQDAPNEMAARVFSNRMWELWTDAPDEPSQILLDKGMEALRYGDHLLAFDSLNKLVSYCPFYAEGYNQRAFLNFLRGDYETALPDLDQALTLNPRHTGALTGKALTLIALGRDDEAQIPLRAAVELNPWLGERALLKLPDGDDI